MDPRHVKWLFSTTASAKILFAVAAAAATHLSRRFFSAIVYCFDPEEIIIGKFVFDMSAAAILLDARVVQRI